MEHKLEDRVTKLTVTRDGTKIISGGWSGSIMVWDVETHKLVKEWTHPESGPVLAISPDDRLLAVGHWNVDIYSMEGRHADSIEVGDSIWSMCFSPDGNKLACGNVSSIRVYDVNCGRLILGPLDAGWVPDVLWSRDGSRLFGSLGRTIRCWNSDTGQQIGDPWTGHTGTICSLSLSPDGTILASASWDEIVRFWNATTGDPIGQHLHRVSAVRFSPSGEFVASVRGGRKICLWQVVTRLEQCQISNFEYVFPVARSAMI